MNIARPEYTKKRKEIWSGDIVSVIGHLLLGFIRVDHIDHSTQVATCTRVNPDGSTIYTTINGVQWPVDGLHYRVNMLARWTQEELAEWTK